MGKVTAIEPAAASATFIPLNFAWLEITQNCQMTCEHCYAGSRPGLGHGKLGVADWKRTMNGLRSLGVREVQFIGGEPTSHPAFCELLDYAAEQGFSIEVYSNLVAMSRRAWETLIRHDVRLATSFYSSDAGIHDAITNLPGSHARTAKNIGKAIESGLVLRAAIIDVRDDQDIGATMAFLQRLGLDSHRISADRVRGVGRGFNSSKEEPTSALCGKCTSGSCVITSEGSVYPCIMARSFPVGNVLAHSIGEIVAGKTFEAVVGTLNAAFAERAAAGMSDCMPQPCTPGCSPSCSPDPNCKPTNPTPCNPGIAISRILPEAGAGLHRGA